MLDQFVLLLSLMGLALLGAVLGYFVRLFTE